jgi:hypothetical protein
MYVGRLDSGQHRRVAVLPAKQAHAACKAALRTSGMAGRESVDDTLWRLCYVTALTLAPKTSSNKAKSPSRKPDTVAGECNSCAASQGATSSVGCVSVPPRHLLFVSDGQGMVIITNRYGGCGDSRTLAASGPQTSRPRRRKRIRACPQSEHGRLSAARRCISARMEHTLRAQHAGSHRSACADPHQAAPVWRENSRAT